MWNWILLAGIVGGLVTLLAVAAVRQRRYAGDKPIGQQHKENTKKGSSGGGNFAGAG
jgi:heme/copper-type cytochrome/quinol oxidase subunit 2